MIIQESIEIADTDPKLQDLLVGGHGAVSAAMNHATSSSFLTGTSQISSHMVSTNNDSKDITYFIKNALIIILGIGDYDNDIMPSLIGVSQDYINCISTFLKMGYCVLYQNKENNIEYVDKYDAKWKLNGKTSKFDLKQCKDNVKTYWIDDEIEHFMQNAKDYIVKHKHDACIFLVSCHGEAQGIILDSTGEELSLESLFAQYDGNQCQYLVDKPKIIFADACRGGMKSKPIATINRKSNDIDIHETENIKDTSQHVDEEKSEYQVKRTENLKKLTILQNNNWNDSVSKQMNPYITNKNKYKNDNNVYHSQANFMFIYPNPDGYAAADGGNKGGYLIRSVKRVFSNLEISLNQTLNEMIHQIRAQTKSMAGKGTLECVQVVDTMTYKVMFEKRVN